MKLTSENLKGFRPFSITINFETAAEVIKFIDLGYRNLKGLDGIEHGYEVDETLPDIWEYEMDGQNLFDFLESKIKCEL